MATINAFNVDSLNLNINPMLGGMGQVIHALNVERDALGVYKKRPGYTTFLGTPDNSNINTLFTWEQDNGSTYLYRASGSILYHSIAGTGAWTTSGNGTITAGTNVFQGINANTLLVSQRGGTTRHSTNGTSFTDTSGAPTQAIGFEEYDGAMWAIGTGSTGFFSATGTPTNWTATDDLDIPGAGALLSVFKQGDRLVFTKTSGKMLYYDGFSLSDLATTLGPSSPYSIGSNEDFRFYLKRNKGFIGYGGAPQIISNPIQRLIYNNTGSAIAGTVFDNAPGICYRNDYFCSVGTVTDDLIYETVANCVTKYNIQYDEWTTWKFANRPTAFGTFKDTSGNEQLIWGDNGGQCYQLNGTATTDNGSLIESVLIGFIHGDSLEDKKWNYIRGMFNPGCKAKISFAISDTFSPRTLQWEDAGYTKDGVVEHKLSGTRGKFLFWRIYEAGRETPWRHYGWEWDAEIIKHT